MVVWSVVVVIMMMVMAVGFRVRITSRGSSLVMTPQGRGRK